MLRNNNRSSEKVCGNQTPFKNGSPVRERVLISRRDNEIKNFTDILNDTSIEGKLYEHNYDIINKATLGNSGDYLMAHNKDGIKVYVLLDQSGILLSRKNDVKYENTTPFLPNSIKNGILNGVQNMSSGAALVCDNGICTLLYDENLNVKEENFGENLGEEQYPLAYPIVRLSEIVNDPIGIDFSIASANKNLINNTFSILNNELQELVDEVKELNYCVNLAKNVINNKSYILENGINKVSTINQQFNKNPPTCDEEREYADNINKILKSKHDQVQTLITIMQKVVNEKNNIRKICEKICQYKDFCNDKIN